MHEAMFGCITGSTPLTSGIPSTAGRVIKRTEVQSVASRKARRTPTITLCESRWLKIKTRLLCSTTKFSKIYHCCQSTRESKFKLTQSVAAGCQRLLRKRRHHHGLDPTVLRLQTDPIWSEIVTFLFQLKQNPFGKLPVHQICQIITAVSARDPGA